MTTHTEWSEARIRQFTTIAPVAAHRLSAAQAAGLAARRVNSKATGALARDVSQPEHVSPLHSRVGSDLVYARLQNEGGTVTPKRSKRLLIRGNRVGSRGTTRSSFGGEIVASAQSVTIPRKGYLDRTAAEYMGLFLAAVKRLMPG